MKLLTVIITLLGILNSCVPEKLVTGIYSNHKGDSLKINDDNSFRIELAEPDTLELRQVKYYSGRWRKEGSKLYLTEAIKAMGGYFECVPMKTSLNTLKRQTSCLDKHGGSLVFHKVLIKKTREKRSKKKEEDK
jgi:hypothetical protein